MIDSTTIVVTAANEALAAIHDRMPVTLDLVGVDQWLAPETPPAACALFPIC